MSAPSSAQQPDLPSSWDGPSRRLSRAEIGRMRELSSRGSPSSLSSPELRHEALRLARRLVDGSPVSRADACLDAVWAAVQPSAMGVAGGRHSTMLKRGLSRKEAARWLAGAQARIEAAFAGGGAS